MAREDTSIVFVGGAYHMPAHFEPIIRLFSAQGYSATAVSLPSKGGTRSSAEQYHDTKAIRSHVEPLVQAGKDVILVCHSYGGYCGCMAVTGLEQSAGATKGLTGGLAKIIFLAAFVIPEGESIVSSARGSLPSWCIFEEDRKSTRPSAECPSLFFSDLSPEDQGKWGALLEPQSALDVVAPVKGACWNVDIPKVFIFTTNDPCSEVSFQRGMLDKVRHLDEKNWTTHEIFSDHAPFLSHPEQLIELLLK